MHGQITVTLTGTSPLLTSNVRGADPEDHYAKLLAPLTAKRSKTDEDKAMIDELGWLSRLYTETVDGRTRVTLPMSNIRKAVIEAARLTRKGKDVERGLVPMSINVDEFVFPDDHLTPKDLYLPGYIDRRIVVVQRQRIPRVRPRFDEWAAVFRVALMESVINPDDFKVFVQTAGTAIGLGDNRVNGFGRFVASFD